MTIPLSIVIGSFVISIGLTALSRRLALRLDMVARPQADRHHRTVIPLGGGVGVFGTLLLGMLAPLILARIPVASERFSGLIGSLGVSMDDFGKRSNELWGLLLCASGLFALGFVDDRRGLGPFIKLAIQLAIALSATVWAGVRVEFFIDNALLTRLLSAVWIVLLINVFNFLDNMDGASAGIAVIVSGILYVGAATSGQIFVGGLILMMIGTLLGFLVFNFPPAKIFMGDSGSLVVGFLVAVLSLRTTYYHQADSGAWYPILLPLIALAVPLYDFVSVTTLRLRQGKSPFVGDTQHFSHRLQRHGLTDTQTVLTLYLATLCTGLGATFLYQVDLTGAVLIFLQTLMILAIIAIFESKVPHDS